MLWNVGSSMTLNVSRSTKAGYVNGASKCYLRRVTVYLRRVYGVSTAIPGRDPVGARPNGMSIEMILLQWAKVAQ